MEEKFQKLYGDYKTSLEENSGLKKAVEAKEQVIRQAEKAKENYKDQVIDLKQEIKSLKSQLKEVSTLDLTFSQNSENILSLKN